MLFLKWVVSTEGICKSKKLNSINLSFFERFFLLSHSKTFQAMKKILLTCLFLILNNLSIVAQNNLQLANLFQSNTINPSQKVTSSYLKALPDGSIYSNTIVSGNVSFFGNQIDTGSNKASLFARIGSTGNLLWYSYITSLDIQPSSYDEAKNIALNTQGETIYTLRTSNNNTFNSNNGTITPLANNAQEIIKISNNGELLWKKSIFTSASTPKVSCFYDKNGDVIIWLGQNMGTDITLDNQNYSSVHSLIAKLDGQTGNLIYYKKYDDLDYWLANLVFDEDNNMYAFYEPFLGNAGTTFNIGNIQINGNQDEMNFLMIKLNSSGNPIFGKNFYENVTGGTNKYSWAIDVKYDGNNFYIYEVLGRSAGSQSFLSLNGVYTPNPYINKSLANEISKVSKTGNVLFSIPIFTSGTYDSNQFDIDGSGNSYIYGRWSDKITINNIEYQMSTYSSNIIKFNSSGNLNFMEPIVQNSFSDLNQKISISGNKLLISGNTSAQSIKGQTINNLGGDNYYIAELLQSGTLSIKESFSNNYLKIYPNPVEDFIQLESDSELSNVKIYDTSGKLVMTTIPLSNKIEILNLPVGNYILEVFDKSNKLIATKRIIKK